MVECEISDCQRPRRKRQWCEYHYNNWMNRGYPEYKKTPFVAPPCRIEWCTKPRKSLGMCSEHYSRWRVFGDPIKPIVRRSSSLSLDEVLMTLDWVIVDSGCWEMLRRSDKGYGIVYFQNRDLVASRCAYEAWVGPIPEGHMVRHKCDNPPCINPDHLETGTHIDNMRDMTERGRRIRLPGEMNPSSKLTWDDVRSIRFLYPSVGKKELSEKYGVTYANISHIINRRTWVE